MSSLNDLEAKGELSEESDNSDSSVILAELKAQVKELEHRNEAKSQAKAALTSLTKRYHKKEKLPTHPCGDLLPYRYSSNSKVNLGRDVISIIGFVCFTKFLTKSQVENLAAHGPSLEKAKLLLAKEKDFHSSWFDCYTNWKKSNRKLAFTFFLEVTDTIKAEEGGHPETRLPDAIGAGSKTAQEAASGVGIPGQKRRRVELQEQVYQPQPIQSRQPHEGSAQRYELTQNAPGLAESHINTAQIWSVQASTSSQTLYGEQFENGVGATTEQQTQQENVLDFSPLVYLPHAFPYKFAGLATAQLDYVLGSQSFLSAAIKTGRRWRNSDRTACFGLAFPSDVEEDAMIMIAVSQWFADGLIQHLIPMQPTPWLLGPQIRPEL